MRGSPGEPMSTVREIAERATEDFESWWTSDGRFIDPDTSDVPWFDKRKELAALAFIEARKPAPLSGMGQRAIGKSRERLAHVLASTEPLGGDLLRAIIYEPGYSIPYDLALRMAKDIEKKAVEIAEIRAQLQAAQQERDRLRAALASIMDGVMVATGRLRKGYSQLHPGISNFCDSYEQLGRGAQSVLATPAATPLAHVYTSTACQHGLHERCRKACKFCGVGCACSCHATEATPPAQEHPDTAALIGRTIIVAIDPPTEYLIVADVEFDVHENFAESTARQVLRDLAHMYSLKPLPDAARTAPEAQPTPPPANRCPKCGSDSVHQPPCVVPLAFSARKTPEAQR